MATKQTKLPENSGRVEPVDLRSEMSRSYLDYAMSVIVGRALPDIRDGLKPVHRRVIYAMYDGGYRPDRSFTKCSRIVGDVMGNYHPHGDTAIYDTLVRLAQEWVMRYPLVTGQGNFGSPGNDGAAAMRYTESRMSSLAMEMVRDIDEDTIDFIPNYDGRTQEPTVLPARIPNLLVNGSSGIAVGMATNIPPHNLREVTNAILWALENPKATKEELFANVKQHVKGPDFPTGGLIVGRNGIDEAYKTGRGSITMRAVVEVSEDNKGRQSLVITELPYQVNPDNLKLKIAELVDTGKITGISDLRDDSSSRTGMRIVIVLKKDAVAKVVLNNLYKHTQLEDTFGANMLALVDGVPRTLSIDQFISNWIEHQIQVIQRRTKFRLSEAEKRAHILSALLKALDKLDEVIALIRKSKTVEDAKDGLKKLLKIDDIQATAILDMQLRKLAALERQKITDEYEELMKSIKDYKDILAKPERQRKIISEELSEIAQKYGDDRKTKFVADEGDKSAEDFIKAEDVVVTISRGGYVKRTRSDLYRAQKRGGKGIKGASLREDDVIEHFFVASTHDWLLVFSDRGKVYRTKVHELPDKGRDAKGQHVANLLSFQPEEKIAAVLSIKNYEQAPYLLLATAKGNIKKSPLSEYDSTRSGGIIGINLKPNDRVISAQLVSKKNDVILVSKKGFSVRCSVAEDSLKSAGRATTGVIGIRFKNKTDELLSMSVVEPKSFLVTATDAGFAKRTPEKEWASKGRGTQGVRAMRISEDSRGSLVGAFIAQETDELFAIASNGVVLRTPVKEIRATGRDTMGVSMMKVPKGVKVVAVTKAVDVENE
ncbi:MAG: DNA gyrase subunit A [Candidatus Nanopelagicales bacterium]